MKAYAPSLVEYPDAQDLRWDGRAKGDKARKRNRVRIALKKRKRTALRRDLDDRVRDW